MRSFLSRPFQINAGPTSVADPDLEIRKWEARSSRREGRRSPKNFFFVPLGLSLVFPFPGFATEHNPIMMLEPLIKRCWMSLDKVG